LSLSEIMKLMLAKEIDAKRIRELTVSNNIKRTDKNKIGFIDYPIPSLNEYKRRIKNNPYFFVLKEKDKVIGFNASYTKNKISKFDVVDDVLKHTIKKTGKILFFEQLAIAQHHRKQGLSYKLYFKMINKAKQKDFDKILSILVTKPITNKVSKHTLEKTGFKLLEKYKSKDKLTFAIYLLNLKNKNEN